MNDSSAKSAISCDLSDRVILITGASSGIGAQAARAIAANGASVVLAARRMDRLEALQAEIEAAGGNATAVEMDVTSEESTKAAFDKAEEAAGPINGLFANAGVDSNAFLVDMEVEEFDHVVAANLRGVFLSVREAGRRMMESGVAERDEGRVVINASLTASRPFSALSAYSATKAGAEQFGRVVAREWARRGINVNILSPGYLKSEIAGDYFDTPAGEKFLSRFPRRRMMDADALNGMLLYLFSDASKFVTGSVFQLDDGQSL